MLLFCFRCIVASGSSVTRRYLLNAPYVLLSALELIYSKLRFVFLLQNLCAYSQIDGSEAMEMDKSAAKVSARAYHLLVEIDGCASRLVEIAHARIPRQFDVLRCAIGG